MPRLLITGASGFLGWSICRAAQPSWQVFGISYTQSVSIEGCTMLRADLTDTNALVQLMQTVRPDAVIHAAAVSQPNACQLDPDLSFAVNVTASLRIADLCADGEIPCVFTSTDQVFAGDAAPYQETDRLNPINRYGEHKAAAEIGMSQRLAQLSICRLPLMYGAVPHAASFIQPFIQKLQAGEVLRLFTDETRTPASNDDVAAGLLLALEHQPSVLHLGGPEALTRLCMGQILADLLGYGDQYLVPCLQAELPMAAPRPANVSFDSSFAQSLSFRPQKFSDELKRLLRPNQLKSQKSELKNRL
jgi:dTDP-4-dehydrorhamnose reductase